MWKLKLSRAFTERVFAVSRKHCRCSKTGVIVDNCERAHLETSVVSEYECLQTLSSELNLNACALRFSDELKLS